MSITEASNSTSGASAAAPTGSGDRMLFVDDRTGSKELMRYLPPQLAQLSRLQFGDACWLGNGPEGVPVHIGVEVKAIGDMLKSIVDGRFSGHQLPGLLRDYHVVYLILEGKYRPARETGLIEIPWRNTWVAADFGARPWMHRDLDGFLTTLEMKYGLKLRKTYDRIETARVIQDLYHWWKDKEWDEHMSGHAFDISQEPVLLPASLLTRIAAQFKGIGWKRAHAVGKHFDTVVDMILAPETEWRNIPGIGKKTAADVVDEIWRHTK